jgi:phosphatidylglycerophosphatase C
VGYLRQRPSRLARLWRLPHIIAGFLTDRDRGLLKGRLIGCVMGADPRSRVDDWCRSFVGDLEPRHTFRPAALAALEAHRCAGDHLVLLSASPDLYVPRIGALLGFERTLCTEMHWLKCPPAEDRLDGTLGSPNLRGGEKSRCLAWLRTQYPGLPVIAYGNAESDIPHLRQADRALMVGGNAAARRAAAAVGIPAADWT